MNQGISVNFHSFVDIITNSSTVIYTYVNSVDAVKEFINEVLANLDNCTLTADDLYEFKVVLGKYEHERYAEDFANDPLNEHYTALNAIYKKYENSGWKETDAAVRKYFDENVDIDSLSYWDFAPETRLVITPKQVSREGARMDLGDLLEKIFTHEATRDG